ncbi:RNA polymerase sigma factor [Steroidobacter sp.]|uniref:RNA polymerase sigma factor n=1 Tax=Steroidobacter sp. TaxID=1978227 RepID=UPI001A58647C|nr:RNA polymerase sigma factor [Steroidobacter sp.]MBL8265654.1 RNA polymerase sigma factor [Steroidobacter sp.]
MTDEPLSHADPSRRGDGGPEQWASVYANDLQRFLAKRRLVESDIKDVCQEVFLRLLRFNRGEVIHNPLAYLFRVAANVAHDFKLRRPQWTSLESETVEEAALGTDASDGPESLADATYRTRFLQRAMAELPPLPRAVLALQYHESLSYDEIAQRLGVSPRVVKRAMARAFTLMREALAKEV